MLVSIHFFNLDLNNGIDLTVLMLAGIELYWFVALLQKLFWILETSLSYIPSTALQRFGEPDNLQ